MEREEIQDTINEVNSIYVRCMVNEYDIFLAIDDINKLISSKFNDYEDRVNSLQTDYDRNTITSYEHIDFLMEIVDELTEKRL